MKKPRLSLEQEAQQRIRMKELLAREFPALDPEDPYYIATLDGETDWPETLEHYIDRYRRAIASAKGLRTQAEEYASGLIARAEKEEALAEHIKKRLERVMFDIGEKSTYEQSYDLVLCSARSKVEVFKPEALPDKYWRRPPPPPPEPDRVLIKKALEEVGTERYREVAAAARLERGEPSLKINLK